MRFLVASTLATLTFALAACSSSSDDEGGRDLGSGGAGAVPGVGGDAGVGGTVGTGASVGTGAVSGTGATGTGGTAPTGPLSMGYILDLPGGPSALDSIDYTAADYVIHAFYTADGAGNVVQASGGHTDDYRTAGIVDKVHAKGRRIVMSLGGANHSDPLKAVAANPALRATFVANVVAKLNEWGYDGVDLDLEFPAGGNEPQEHYDLMSALYAAVKANDPNDIVMFGVSPGYYLNQYKWAQLGAVSDYAFYFCYDWRNPALGPMKNPGQMLNTSFGGPAIEASCSGALNFMLSQGYAASQIVVGLPFYATDWSNYAAAPDAAKNGAPDPNYMEVNVGGVWWPNVAGTLMKMDAVLNAPTSVLTGGATVAGVGWWEWGYENPSSPDLSAAIKQKLGK